MDAIQELLATVTPKNFDSLSFLKIMLILSVACFLLGILLRVLCGKRSSLNHSVCSAIGILMIYVVSIALFTTDNHYEIFLNPLPFISFAGDYLSVFVLKGAGISALCTQLLRMMILAFLVNLLDLVIPKGKNFFTWYFFRCISVVLGMLGSWLISWLFTTYLPGFLVTYAPVVMVILIVLLLAVTVFKLLVGVTLGVTLGPVVGAIYTFFFSNIIGKQIAKAAFTTLLLTVLVAVLNHFGITIIAMTSAALVAFVPVVLMLIIVWYLLYKFL